MKQKKFGIVLLSCVMVISLLFTSTAYAQDEELQLPNPGITPDSPFYFADIWGKKIGLFFTFGAEAKANKALEYAEERLAEVRIMAAKNKSRGVKQAVGGYDEFLAIVTEKAEEARRQGVSGNISEIVALATSKHLSIFDEVEDIVPEEAKEAIAQARGASINGLGNGLRALATENPERAMEINLAAVEGRLNRAKAKAEGNEIDEVENALNEFETLSGFGREIAEMARGLSDNTTVEQLVARAASHHLEVLALVYDKVPEQAKPAIESVMAVSVTGLQKAIEALMGKGALGEIPEEVTLPAAIPNVAKKRILKLKVPKPGVSESEEEEEVEAPGRGRSQKS